MYNNKNFINQIVIALMVYLASCSTHKNEYPFLYGEYMGMYPGKPGSVNEQSGPHYFEIKITKDSMYYLPYGSGKEMNGSYCLKEETDSLLELETTVIKGNDTALYSFTYYKDSGILNFQDLKDKASIILKNKHEYLLDKVKQFAICTLKTDISKLSEKEREMLPILIETADIMDELCWKSFIGNKEEFFSKITDSAALAYTKINYGPWDRMEGDISFLKGYAKPFAGALYYPSDITKQEFESFDNSEKSSWYTFIRRNEQGKLYVEPYNAVFRAELERAASLLRKASKLAEDPGLAEYLKLRAEALLNDDYLASDLAWMNMKTNKIDFIVGPIESYNDQFMGIKTTHSGQILIKDLEWSKKLEKYAAFLPELQAKLPVEAKYKKEKAQANKDMNVYDVIYYAGDCNVGAKNIAINLPNDPRVHEKTGSRKLQLKNTMQAKFEKILVPISNILIAEEQRKYIKFEAFFEDVMFHEVAHGLGLKSTITGKGLVKEALQEYHTSIEEGKADIIGLYIITLLAEKGEFENKDLLDNYVTFAASIFRSIRFGASSAHGKANMICFNYFLEKNVFSRDDAKGTYFINFEKMKQAISDLGGALLKLQGDGDFENVRKLVEEKGSIGEMLQNDLERIANAGIPKDIVFEQGLKILGL
ncbi:MAG: Zn-dependent hydrolase [Bacteroidia bacterium]|nr:Zn-dependent hydrolase [Bacteroidia bacterium]